MRPLASLIRLHQELTKKKWLPGAASKASTAPPTITTAAFPGRESSQFIEALLTLHAPHISKNWRNNGILKAEIPQRKLKNKLLSPSSLLTKKKNNNSRIYQTWYLLKRHFITVFLHTLFIWSGREKIRVKLNHTSIFDIAPPPYLFLEPQKQFWYITVDAFGYCALSWKARR